MVINVEYNQLDPLLRASGYPNGDVNCETGYSPFPGNINQVTLFFILQHPPPSHATYLFNYIVGMIYYSYLHCSHTPHGVSF